MHWIADGTHDFTVADRQKNLSEELIVSWITGALNDISEEMIELSLLVYPNHNVFMLVLHNHFLCFLLPFFFFQSVVQNRGAYYTWARIIHGQIWY